MSPSRSSRKLKLEIILALPGGHGHRPGGPLDKNFREQLVVLLTQSTLQYLDREVIFISIRMFRKFSAHLKG